MKNIRLSPTDARIWRSNTSVLVDKTGEKLRDITLAETKMVSELQKRARHTRQPMMANMVDGDPSTAIVVSFTEIAPRTLTMKTTIGGFELLDGREHFKRQVLKIHGECQLRKHTGQFMCTVRDPNYQRPTVKDSMRSAPKPEHCQCAKWGAPHAGRHHSICEWNAGAPDDEKALVNHTGEMLHENHRTPAAIPSEKPSILKTPARLNAATAMASNIRPVAPLGMPASSGSVLTMPVQPVVREAPSIIDRAPASPPPPAAPAAPMKVPSPAECVCSQWEWPQGRTADASVHHPICQWKEIWDSSRVPRMLLVNLTTGGVERQATMAEITEASGTTGYITIGDTQYGVVPEGDVNNREQRQAPAAE
jgi:hypothetical protein